MRWHRRGGEAPVGSGKVAIVAAAGQIVGLGLVAVGLALEADAVVGHHAVAVAHHEYQPFGAGNHSARQAYEIRPVVTVVGITIATLPTQCCPMLFLLSSITILAHGGHFARRPFLLAIS